MRKKIVFKLSLKGIAKETLKILEEGFYISPSGQQVKIDEEHKAAVNGTILYTPMEAISLLKKENTCLPGQTRFLAFQTNGYRVARKKRDLSCI